MDGPTDDGTYPGDDRQAERLGQPLRPGTGQPIGDPGPSPTAAAPAIEERVSTHLPPAGEGSGSSVARLLTDASRVDHAVYAAVARTETPSMDVALRRLSSLANNSVLWLGIASGLAVAGGQTGRRAALHGVLSIGVTSALVNIGVKSLGPRRRPDREAAAVPEVRHVRMPTSSSFPSGHSASAFAFAEAVGIDVPALALPLRALAATVAYSRVHTGVHYPGDALAGALIGSATGLVVSSWMPSWSS